MNQQANGIYEFGSFRLDVRERLLQRDGATISLTPKAFDLLLALIVRHGRLVDKEELFQTVWPDTIVEESNLSSNIALIRKALGDGTNGERYIETVPKRGYRFVAEVRKPGAEQAKVPEATARKIEEKTSRLSPDKKGAFLTLFVIVLGGAAFGLWKFTTRTEPKSSRPEPKIIPFTSVPGSESQPAFSPDGRQIAFVGSGEKGDNEDIYVKLLDAGEALRLTTSPAAETSPAWSPDGRYIAFIRRTAEDADVYLVPALGGPERKLTNVDGYIVTLGRPARLAWHPDGEWLAVADKSAAAESVSISLLSVTTGERRKLTAPPAGYFGDWNPAFSPDGKTLAFLRGKTGIHLDLYVMPTSGGEPLRLTEDGAHKKSLAWTADGREIIFSSSRGGSVNTAMLWKIPAAGGTPERLAGLGQNVFSLAIAGNWLAYEQGIHDTNVYRIDTAESARPPTKLIASTFQDDSPSYSPDGQRLAFVSDRTGSLEIWRCDSEGGNAMALTNFGGAHTGTPRWSPDGQWIVFDSNADDSQEIFVIGAEGGQPRRLTFDAALDIHPSWSRDGRWIYFSSNRSGDFQLWKVAIAGGAAVQVTKQGGVEGFASGDGRFIYYARRMDFRNLWRVPVEGGDESLILDRRNAEHRRSWAVVEKGVYFAVAETPLSSVIEFFSFAAGRVERRVATLERAIKQGPPGLTVSPDERWILYTRIDQSGSDIMLMENFR
jgi:Tol biopolymer transport system component